jgi:ubiquinol-cytochrome c reductase cytochrome b subunit
MKGLFDWIDARTGYRWLARHVLYEHVPGGARWRYVWGSTLTFAITVQFITGIVLWMNYSAGAQSAWESVYFIQDVLPGGWVLRGIHHFTAQLMVPLLVLHFMQVIIDGAYRAPRELNYWFGLGLLVLTLALSLTGYLLPWDQKGYWATKVATNLAATVPVIGDSAQRILVGDANYGHHTLTRFFALHAGVLPAALVALIFAHVALFRRHGLTAKLPKRRADTTFWPDQVLCDAVACLAVIAAVLGLVWWFHGAELTAPANPAEQYSAARPDWYFMALFQFLKYFQGERLIFGSVIVPGLVFLLLAFMPFLGRWRIGHWFNFFVLFAGLSAYTALTLIAYSHDLNSDHYRAAVEQGHRDAARVKALAKEHQGIPPGGALTLLHDDAPTQGPRLFAAKCASCHTFNGHDGLGAPLPESPTAPDLAGFGSREWLTGFLDAGQIETPKYFGGTAFAHPPAGKRKSKMVRYVLEDVPKFTADDKQQLTKIIAALSAEAKLPTQSDADPRDAALIADGAKLLGDSALKCADCHAFHVDDQGSGPDLTGYASREWMLAFVQNPAHEKFYGDKNDRMPPFGEKGELSARQIEFIVDWLRSGARY